MINAVVPKDQPIHNARVMDDVLSESVAICRYFEELHPEPALFGKPTAFFEDVVNKGRTSMTALPDFTPLQGGVPIIAGSTIVGAIGVSGAASAAQDAEIAEAGAKAVAALSVAR